MATAPIREKHDGALAGQMDVRVWLRLLSCVTVIEKRLRRRFVAQYDTTLPRFDVMATLERFPDGVSMGELSRALLVSNGNVTALVKQLESDGYASSRPAPDDRRSSIVALTDLGRRHFAELAAAHRTWIQGMFAELSDNDHIELYKLLAVLKHSIGADDEK
ncbi:MarR family winged helix-turn-helix transcriptional regulator [Rhizorhabdus wittichii]|jgi:DNA-binding MarR family transcriptional regulator|uniref:Transcriptional regulator, MarR family n=2 Tax=Rhizorhabdus wittichii TaxID=160791 RepID=A0A9J9H989_RHIWR|nr:MarR family transcriptional regulator [Rhizorhabdus wittichii]ABQ67197.1 transcriptional regulator, MarR family [Rhizorhabdus wittichii RW1]ARR56029.1 MarR family transcriptional regulator [Rhizorhabdus wittichii DC-6]QTH23198.1 MarR family transcriptional regulator [Rhizorhabdus wittichii]